MGSVDLAFGPSAGSTSGAQRARVIVVGPAEPPAGRLAEAVRAAAARFDGFAADGKARGPRETCFWLACGPSLAPALRAILAALRS